MAKKKIIKTVRKCLNWVLQIKAVCPCCLHVNYYDEIIDKVKGKEGERLRCKKCKKKFQLGNPK